ncbi:coiled-coil domain-containing protein 15 isoform X14 [Pongo abelii]|uniref:coiled-coil domain-containing protein 15 isoform X14 n=1 Tax=Pongo abelii TaxID=9601 RepID=UPI0023E8A21D|nr:coiled-coil domain-containing protein 15 isoform X10 [Pongo abelii]
MQSFEDFKLFLSPNQESQMLGSMARKKPRNTSRLPLALNPVKSKDVLAVLAERNQAIVPVGAWVEPASPGSSEIPAYTSAYLIEEELKEQLRKKQEALKHFQKQVKYRVNQQIRLRKKQQLQKSYERAQKEGSIAMQSSAAHLTSKRTSVFPNNLNVAIGSSRLPPSLMPGDGIEDEENQNELFQQQARALSETMKQARHRLASFKTVIKEKGSVFPDDGRESFLTPEEVLSRKPASAGTNTGIRTELPIKVHQGLLAAVPYQNYMENQELDYEEPDYEESSSLVTDEKGKEDFFGRGQQDQQAILSEDKNKPFSRVQKVKFKNPLFVLMEEEEQKQLHFEGLQDILPEAQDYFPEAQGDLLETQGDLTGIQSVKPDTQAVELKVQVTEPEGQAIEPEGQPIKTETQGIMLKAQSIELEEGSIVLKTQDFLPTNQAFLTKNQDVLLKDHCVLPKDQSILLKYQDQDFLPRDQHVLPKDQDILPKYQDQDFLPKDQNFSFRDQHVLPKDPNILPKYQDQDFLPKDQDFLSRDQHVLPKDWNILPKCRDQDFLPRDLHVLSNDQNILPKCQDQDFLPKYQNKHIKPPSSFEKREIARGNTPGVPLHRSYEQASRDMTDERWRKELLPERHGYILHEIQDPGSAREQAYDGYQSGLSTEFQAPLAFQSGVDKEEDKKERQKQYLRHRRIFMDIEREQVREQQRQKEQKKKIERIKKKREQERYAEEQRIVRMNFHEDPYSGEKMSEILAQLQLEEIKGAREKQQREKEYLRYVEALRAQIQEKMQLYNITLPPLCCCGPDFWDAHPDTCANNCIFYKNHRVSLCRPSQSAVARSRLTATAASWVQAPQPTEYLGLQVCATTSS